MVSFFKKTGVRMQYKAPSFLSFRGKRALVAEPKEASREITSCSPAAVVFIPGPVTLSEPRAWANALSYADYLVVLGRECPEMSKLLDSLDRIVFSPVARKLSSVHFAQSGEEAESLLLAVRDQGYNEILIEEESR